MKKYFTLVLPALFFLQMHLPAQNPVFWGLTNGGGREGLGTLFNFTTGANTCNDLYNFNADTSGFRPTGSLVHASNGLLYGNTTIGGAYNYGVIFSFNPASNTYACVHNFDSATGSVASGKLLQCSNGLLYGLTTQGGPKNAGVIYSLDPASNTYTVLYNFMYDSTSGDFSLGSLMEASNGLLYGLSNSGGLTNHGVLFSFDLSSNTYTNLYSFNWTNASAGANPGGSLVQAPNGLLYGLNSFGCTENGGGIFSYDPVTSTYTPQFVFAHDSLALENAGGSLILATNGLLYGLVQDGGTSGVGVIFSFNTATSTFNIVYNFSGDSTSGANPAGSLMQASNGLLYGMTMNGGQYSAGVVFSFNTANNTYTNLYNFANDSTSGSQPYGDLMEITKTTAVQPVTPPAWNTTVSPNPFATSFCVQLSSGNGDNTDMEIYDMLGRQLMAKRGPGSNATIEAGETLASGTYLLHIKQGNDEKTTLIVKK